MRMSHVHMAYVHGICIRPVHTVYAHDSAPATYRLGEPLTYLLTYLPTYLLAYLPATYRLGEPPWARLTLSE